jgi:signal transduction histidine kinase
MQRDASDGHGDTRERRDGAAGAVAMLSHLERMRLRDSSFQQALLVYGACVGIGLINAFSHLAMLRSFAGAAYQFFATLTFAPLTVLLWRRVLPRFVSLPGWRRVAAQVGVVAVWYSLLSFLLVEACYWVFGLASGSILHPYSGGDLHFAISAEALRRVPYLFAVMPIVPSVVMCVIAFNQHWWRQGREEELRELALSSQLAALRAQVNPHFLFNSLNSIAQLISTDPAKAEECVEKLGEIYRYVLRRAHVDMVPLEDELRVVEAYLDIERARFGDSLSVEAEIEDAARAVLLPSLILQPLVENAVKHGISPKVGGGRVTIQAHCVDGDLCLAVRDTGVGVRGGSVFSRGVGLSNVRERLINLYGAAYEPVVESGGEGGTSVFLRVPRLRGAVA